MIEHIVVHVIVLGGAGVLLAGAVYLFASYMSIQRQLRELENKNEQD
jgi:hypothetical protein